MPRASTTAFAEKGRQASGGDGDANASGVGDAPAGLLVPADQPLGLGDAADGDGLTLPAIKAKVLERVAEQLGEALLEQLVFVGGAVAGVLITDPAMPEIRPPQDVDVICRVLARSDCCRKRLAYLLERTFGWSGRQQNGRNRDRSGRMATGCRNSMQAFSVRQLKSNPSTVLKAAAADAMALVTSHQQPTALVVALDRLGVPNTAAVRSGLALSLFRSGSISVGSAAQIAGLPLPRFMEILSSLKIPVVEGDQAELDDDLALARRWLGE